MTQDVSWAKYGGGDKKEKNRVGSFKFIGTTSIYSSAKC